MYRRAYGGLEHENGVDNDVDQAWPLPHGGNYSAAPQGGEVPIDDDDDDETPMSARSELSKTFDTEYHPTAARRAKRTGMQLLGQWSPDAEKEILFLGGLDMDEDDEDQQDEAKRRDHHHHYQQDLTYPYELEAIEAWYRDVQIDVHMATRHDDDDGDTHAPPAAVHHTETNEQNIQITILEDLHTPPSTSTQEQQQHRLLQQLRRTTPKLSPPPAARRRNPSSVVMAMGLKLQTDFNAGRSGSNQNPTPPATSPRRQPPPPAVAAALQERKLHLLIPAGNVKEGGGGGGKEQGEEDDEEEEEDEDEDLTARPKSAIAPTNGGNDDDSAAGVSPVVFRWGPTVGGCGGGGGGGGGISNIDMVLRDDWNEDGHERRQGRQLQGGDRDDKNEGHDDNNDDDDGVTGPMTPNGYDDISPITRGEWGFLMGAKAGKTVAVEMW